jgi:ABC-2 type transport system ATP-binding protein
MVEVAEELAVDLRDVAKTYRRGARALRGIEMHVHRGEIYGLLGPNGAGKSTLVKIMMTVVRPNRAQGTILGRPMGTKSVLARIGYLPEPPRFPGYLTGRQAVEFYGALSRVNRATRKRRAAELLAFVGLSEAADAKIPTYSKGMAQRLGLAQALVNDPELVVLDEPSEGVDPVGRRDIRRVLVDLRRQGRTIFLNSHLLGEVEMICDRVGILVQGLVVRQGTLDELTKERQFYEIEIELGRPGDPAEAIRAALPVELGPPGPPEVPGDPPVARGQIRGGRSVELAGSVLRVNGAGAADIQPVIDALRRQDLTIRVVRPVRQSLEDLFIETVTSGAEEGGPGRPGGPSTPPPPPPFLLGKGGQK